MEKHPDGTVTLTAAEFNMLGGRLLDQQKKLEDSLALVNGALVTMGLRDVVTEPVMTLEAQDKLAAVIARDFSYDGGLKNIDESSERGSRLRAISRLTQSIADTFSGSFDRKRFVQKAGFSSLEGF